ncbi:MAG: DUF4236 domain-containing protein [Phycisphaerae bacterium]
MGYVRFFRRVRVAPGLTVNFSKHGASLSAGFRGAHVTVGRTGIRRTVGVPGTGVFYTSRTGYHSGLHSGHHFAQAQRELVHRRSSRNILITLGLCVLFGLIGMHHFYAGNYIRGIFMLVLSLTGYGLIITIPWWIIDTLIILFGSFTDGQGDRIQW